MNCSAPPVWVLEEQHRRALWLQGEKTSLGERLGGNLSSNPYLAGSMLIYWRVTIVHGVDKATNKSGGASATLY